jgi:hypothetical protein
LSGGQAGIRLGPRGFLNDPHRRKHLIFAPGARSDLHPDRQAGAALFAACGDLLRDILGLGPLAFLVLSHARDRHDSGGITDCVVDERVMPATPTSFVTPCVKAGTHKQAQE